MSYSLVYSAKPSTTSVLVYEPGTKTHNQMDTIKACGKLIDAIFRHAFHYRIPKRLHIKGDKYMYIPSDAYKIIRVKYFNQ